MTDIKKLLSEFERYAHGQSLHNAFTGMLDWILLPFKEYRTQAEQDEALETYRSHPKANSLVSLVTLIGDLSEEFSDPIGELFMVAISNGHNGQYFTPENISDFMASISLGDSSTPGQTVCDCACGSGRMLLSAAKINRHLLLYGADLDITCCKMALLNMLLNSLQGEIAHMDSLSNDFHRGFKVSTILVNGYHMPYYTEFKDPQQSQIWLRPVMSKPKFDTPFEPIRASHMQGVQGSLF